MDLFFFLDHICVLSEWLNLLAFQLDNDYDDYENTCVRVSFLLKLLASGLQHLKKATLAHVFSYEFFEVSKKTFFTEHPRTPASV